MDAISYTSVRTNLAKTMEQVCEDHSPIIITRNKACGNDLSRRL
ncbi:type II toxin-antitoxin system Phd/YefM family antitoxin [Vreelandella arcis]|nr:type II toxin-antitoxin system Phd/YefM family antitoxin [Halomonas arcis]